MFVENVGQFDSTVRFQVTGAGGTIYFTPNAIWLTVRESTPPPSPEAVDALTQFASSTDSNISLARVDLRLSFAGANPAPQIVGFHPLNTTASYFIGDDPNQRYTAAPVYEGMRYVELYPGLDLEITGEAGQWVWRLVPQTSGQSEAWPFASLAQTSEATMTLQVEGADALAIADNQLQLSTALGELSLPLIQTADTPQAAPSLNGDQVVSPFVGPEVAWPSSALQAEAQSASASNPQDLLYSTLLGGSLNDQAQSVAVDTSGAVYATGDTDSPVSDFPSAPGYKLSPGIYSAVFVTKLHPNSTSPIYVVYIDGDHSDAGKAIAVALDGTAYITGGSGSSNFPTTTSAFNANNGGYVAKLSAYPKDP